MVRATFAELVLPVAGASGGKAYEKAEITTSRVAGQNQQAERRRPVIISGNSDFRGSCPMKEHQFHQDLTHARREFNDQLGGGSQSADGMRVAPDEGHRRRPRVAVAASDACA